MKPKKPAFTNSSTGYGKSKHNYNKSVTRDGKGAAKDTKDEQKNEKDLPKEQNDKDLNSGFGDYLRSPEAVEMMKLFVFANSVMMIVTMAWPQVKEQYIWLMSWLATWQEE